MTKVYAVLIIDPTHIHRDHRMDLGLWIETWFMTRNMTVNAAIFSARKAIPNSPVARVAAVSGGVPVLKIGYCLFSVSPRMSSMSLTSAGGGNSFTLVSRLTELGSVL